MRQRGAERLDPTHPVVRHEIVQERTKLELPVLRSRELLQSLPVGGQFIKLYARYLRPYGPLYSWRN